MRNYAGLDNDKKPKQAYLDKLAAMTDAELEDETGHAVWLSAYASNNPRSDYHWRCDACYDEAQRRGKPDIYTNAWNAQFVQAGGVLDDR